MLQSMIEHITDLQHEVKISFCMTCDWEHMLHTKLREVLTIVYGAGPSNVLSDVK